MLTWARALVLAVLGSGLVFAQSAPPRPPVAPRAAVGAPRAEGAPRTATARALQTATPESVGVSSSRLTRLHEGMQGYVDRHEAGGIVTLIVRDGKIADIHAAGWQDVERRVPMRADTVVRIASMTKPITAVAVMMLEEEGRLLLTDPVSKFIPAFKGQRVAAEGRTAVPARREVTIRDLLTHRSGLTYGFINGGAVGDAYRREGVSDGLTQTDVTLQQNIDKLAAQPLLAQPGAAWNYSLSSDVLGRVVEVASGTSFDKFLHDRIFVPLSMHETSFDVPEARWGRFATVYSPDGAGGIRPMKDPESFGNTRMSPWEYYKPGKIYFSGGAGLTSTARDYAQFAQMLANGGVLDGVRLLSPKTIELMTSNHTSDVPPTGLIGAGAQFGLGFRVVNDVALTQTQGSVGMFGWLGIYGTSFFVDPKEHLVAIVLVQRYPGSRVADGFQPLVYQSLVR